MYCIFLGKIQKGILAGCSECSAKPASFSWIMWTFLCVEHFTWPRFTHLPAHSLTHIEGLRFCSYGCLMDNSFPMACGYLKLTLKLRSLCFVLFFLSLFLLLFSLDQLLDWYLLIRINVTATREPPRAISIDPLARSICPSHRWLGTTWLSDCQLRTGIDLPW